MAILKVSNHPKLQGYLNSQALPSEDLITPAEIIVILAFLNGPKDPDFFEHEELADVFGNNLLDADTIKSTIETLISKGFLQISDESPTDKAGRGGAEAAKAHLLIRSIARLTSKIAGDLSGFGSYPFRQIPNGEVPMIDRLENVRAVLVGIFRELKRSRSRYVRAQLEWREASLRPGKIRINIGSGTKHLPKPWMNIDFPGSADLAMNVLWGLPFADNSAECIYTSHFFEHIDYRSDAIRLLKDCHRVLAFNGILRIVVPNIEGYMQAYTADDTKFFEERCQESPFYRLSYKTNLEHTLNYAGAGACARPDHFFDHKFGYDFQTLSAFLREAGFQKVMRSAYMESACPILRVDDSSSVAHMEFNGISNSLFVEAIKNE
jgi:predicted SAM-dependent methyltransferase